MKKYLKFLCCLFAGFAVLTACDNDDPEYKYVDAIIADGVFILNEGSYFYQVDGSLDYLGYYTSGVSRNVFQAVNGRKLGGTPNNAIVCGTKMYIATQEENRVEVVDARTLKAFSPVNIVSPRELCTDGEFVYVTSYEGTVAKIDTATLSVVKKSEVIGANLEGIAYRQGFVYACNAWNSDYTYNTNVVKLNASTLSKEKDITVAANPNQIVSDGTNLYVASWGDYADVAAVIQRIDGADQVTTLANGTHFALHGDNLYIISSAYDENYAEVNSYSVYDLKAGVQGKFIEGSEIFSPCTIGADPITGIVFITSRNKDDYGYPSYTTDGYVCAYWPNGTFIGKYACGVNPGTLVFISHVEQVAYSAE